MTCRWCLCMCLCMRVFLSVSSITLCCRCTWVMCVLVLASCFLPAVTGQTWSCGSNKRSARKSLTLRRVGCWHRRMVSVKEQLSSVLMCNVEIIILLIKKWLILCFLHSSSPCSQWFSPGYSYTVPDHRLHTRWGFFFNNNLMPLKLWLNLYFITADILCMY